MFLSEANNLLFEPQLKRQEDRIGLYISNWNGNIINTDLLLNLIITKRFFFSLFSNFRAASHLKEPRAKQLDIP